MSINVLNAGLLTTIQDIGRTGSQKFGVLVSGAMDSYSMRIANLLVGNDEREGVLEITLFGTMLRFEEDTLIAITGGDLQTTIDGIPVANWRPVIIKKGSILKFGFAIEGCRAYLAIAGGIDIPVVMGSKSTYLVAGIGGFKGRALQQNDHLSFGQLTESNDKVFTRIEQQGTPDWAVPHHPFISLASTQTIRIMEGTEYQHFDEASKQRLVSEPYVVTPQSNRMGLRLEGQALSLTEKLELLSEGVTFGTIQIPPNGKPIILMADRQTAGGYPKIGQVITADLGSLSQVKPNAELTFKLITHAEAERELIAKEEQINQIKIGIQQKLQ
ncbi:KipI antagonist [Sporosarcina sp. P21c]|uniref:5-oxoprolinase subunit C family protein n=1 Tax=unclassified Sporosarcina TaxID=2647733 RepID=UPI000C1678C6|nr:MULTISPECIES: biotin-dependent carboxyltransferase family protein [unclassified Sporosarcina]PIC65922.1 KipI antagonist [Sporosarcina sp. P16a]PIC88539.1 KipI antagonist [Sporosarcina sp. P21c]PIC91989.1 KipI antagonist [Sporosarcina sp. P25]